MNQDDKDKLIKLVEDDKYTEAMEYLDVLLEANVENNELWEQLNRLSHQLGFYLISVSLSESPSKGIPVHVNQKLT
jgi:hypothetical protein